jgi:hypothetical protein
VESGNVGIFTIVNGVRSDKMKPTEEQIKQFWKWYGWEYSSYRLNGQTCWGWHLALEKYNFQDCLPSTDLNNLFRFAVPKVKCLSIDKTEGGWWVSASVDCWNVEDALDKEIEDALFWAIYKAAGLENENMGLE